jgi:ABC-type transport system substrate-binding protein
VDGALRPGIFFADDPAFKGAKRELVAQDFVYTAQALCRPGQQVAELAVGANSKILGLAELRDKALIDKQPFDYDTEIPGLRALDRYTLQITLGRRARALPRAWPTARPSAPWRARWWSSTATRWRTPGGHRPLPAGAVAASVADRARAQPRSYRERVYDAQPAPTTPKARPSPQRCKGQRLPLVDRVEISIIEEAQPRWLSFLNRQIDLMAVPQEFSARGHARRQAGAQPGQEGHPGLARAPFTQLTFFNMEHPVVGGYEPHKVALRRAMFLAWTWSARSASCGRGQAIPAQACGARTSGYDPPSRARWATTARPRAKALLDLYGYVDRDGDGWREQPDGQPLVLEYDPARPA